MQILATLASMGVMMSGAASAPVMDSDAAMKALKDGNMRYTSGKMVHGNMNAARRAEVAKGQSPHTIVLTCADSRLSPEILFDQGLGDLFVIRVAGNIWDTNTLASAEYSAAVLGSSVLLVLGHERCGAVDAAKSAYEASLKGEGSGLPGNLPQLVNNIMPAVRDVDGKSGDFLANAISRNVMRTITAATEKSPVIYNLSKAGSLKIVGGVYDLDTGVVEFMDHTKAENAPAPTVTPKKKTCSSGC